jgi:hypothetical protein
MPRPYTSVVISAPIDKVWSTVRDFGALSAWHPVIASSSLDSGADGEVGAVRRLTTGDGGVIVERLLTIDDDGHTLTYTILESPFAVRRYVSTMHLSPVTESGDTFVEWFAEFDAEAADEADLMTLFGDGVFGAGLTALRTHVAA